MIFWKGLVRILNSHIVVGMVEKVSIIKAESRDDYLAVRVTERTVFNGCDNSLNDYSVIKYGGKEELERIKETLSEGMAVYISGTGYFDSEGQYFIVANDLLKVEKIEFKIGLKEYYSKEDDAVAYLKAEYEKLEKG